MWAISLVGRRSYRNAKAMLDEVILRGRVVGCPLIVTDGFEYYFAVIGRLMGHACVYGQVSSYGGTMVSSGSTDV